MADRVVFVMLGRKDFLSGGYIFNFRMVEHLRSMGMEVKVIHYRTVPEGLADHWLQASRYVSRVIRESDPDLVIVSKSYHYVPGFRLSRASGRIPVLYLMHHLEWMDIGNRIRSGLYRMYVRWLLGMADMVWANSRNTGNELQRLGIDSSKIRIISPGFDKTRCGEEREPVEEGPVRILCVGSLCPRKNQLAAIEACSLLDDLDFTLDLIGSTDSDPDYTSSVRDMIDRLGLSEKVRVRGSMEGSFLETEYERADFLVHPASWEAFGMSVIEGMWHGLPVIACDVAAMPELITQDENGFLFEPGDHTALAEAMRRLIMDPGLRIQMGMRSRGVADSMNCWEDTGREFAELVEMTLERCKS